MRDGEIVDSRPVMILMMRRRVPVITPDLIITECQAVITDH